jgi:hypothetical protein
MHLLLINWRTTLGALIAAGIAGLDLFGIVIPNLSTGNPADAGAFIAAAIIGFTAKDATKG